MGAFLFSTLHIYPELIKLYLKIISLLYEQTTSFI
jgi:hypothetical protein